MKYTIQITNVTNHLHVYCYSSLLTDLLNHLQSHPLPSLHYLDVWCYDDNGVRALTTFLPQCTNLRTLYYERVSDISESVEEEMWEAAVRRCRSLEEVRVRDVNISVSSNILMSVLKNLCEREGIQALKLRKFVEVDCNTLREVDNTEKFQHLLPALQ